MRIEKVVVNALPFNTKRGLLMQAYAYEMTIAQKGILTLKNVPFNVGEEVEVIIIPRSKPRTDMKSYPFLGKPITYFL